MKRLVLPAVALVAVACVGGLLLFRGSGALPDKDLTELKAIESLDEALLWRTEAEKTAPRFADHEAALAAGYVSLETQQYTVWEHLMNWPAVEDDTILDPEVPEALLYRVENGKWTLAALVFLLPSRYNFANTPRVADGAAIWHNHPTVCLKGDPMKDPELGTIDLVCREGKNFPPNLMIHAWVQPNPCGPFATAIVENETLELITEGVSGLDANGKIPGCERELAERVWPGVGG